MIRLDVPEVHLPPLAGDGEELWRLLLDLAEHLPVSWTLVGGHMALLHGLQHDRTPPRVSAVITFLVVTAVVTGCVEILRTLRYGPVLSDNTWQR